MLSFCVLISVYFNSLLWYKDDLRHQGRDTEEYAENPEMSRFGDTGQ